MGYATNTVSVGVIGHTGRLGKPLVEILKGHPYANIVYTGSRKEGSQGKLADAQLVFLSLPEGESAQYLQKLRGKRIIDLSVDHRASEGWIYGLPEINKEYIKNARLVANPGCYPTSISLGLYPIWEDVSNVRIASTSGISGAGLKRRRADNFQIYKEARAHQHIAEIENALGLEGILFVPQRIDVADRGIISTIFADYEGKENLEEIYEQFYRREPFVRILGREDTLATKNVIRTNWCDIKVLKENNTLIVMSAVDNIIKGGAGQAVQNFNLMYGFDEKAGLSMKTLSRI